jgi:hypothetical protein
MMLGRRRTQGNSWPDVIGKGGSSKQAATTKGFLTAALRKLMGSQFPSESVSAGLKGTNSTSTFR